MDESAHQHTVRKRAGGIFCEIAQLRSRVATAFSTLRKSSKLRRCFFLSVCLVIFYQKDVAS